MTRTSKQAERRNANPKKRRPNLSKKTGSKKDNLERGYKEHANAVDESSRCVFIGKVK
jgi:hypothetical protein